MKLTLSRLRCLVREALVRESPTYDLNVDQIQQRWPDQFDDAVYFAKCHMRLDGASAKAHVVNNWKFDTMKHGGQEFLLARDEATGESLAYQEKMGGWYLRLGDNKKQCRQTDSQRERNVDRMAPTQRQGTGTRVSGGTGTKVSAGIA